MLAAATIRDQLHEVGLPGAVVEVTLLDSGSTIIVQIVHNSFDGQTFLDRELRVRPTVAKALAKMGYPRAAFVIEPETPDESIASFPPLVDESTPPPSGEPTLSRAKWFGDIDTVTHALIASHYRITEIEPRRIIIAERTHIARDVLLIGFAASTTAKTVDLNIRKALQNIRSSQDVSRSFYLVPRIPSHPFANQQNANWLTLDTPSSFLHRLGSSQMLADRQLQEFTKESTSQPSEHHGPVIDPDIRLQDNTVRSGFFRFVENWRAGTRPSLLVVMAPAGHGKTTLVSELARQLAVAHTTDSSSHPVPLLVPFESVRRLVDFDSLLNKRLSDLCPGEPSAFIALLQRNDAILIIDGFDELVDDAGFEVASAQIRAIGFRLQGSAKVVLAGRSLFTEGFAGQETVANRMRSLLGEVEVEVVEVLPFSRPTIEDYISSRDGLSPTQRTSITNFIDSNPDHEQLGSNPLFLRLLCALGAASALPHETEFPNGLADLLTAVMRREEIRQHLGIGVNGQLAFLEQLALEIHRTGPLRRIDVEASAELCVGHDHVDRAQTIARLLSHALLQRNKAGLYEFIHPYVRDIVLALALASQMKMGHFEVLETSRDLPEASIRYLASQGDDLVSALPRDWLAKASGLKSRARRALFRLTSGRSRYKRHGNPREWIEGSWSVSKQINDLDLRGLVIESISIDGCVLNRCDLSGSYIDDVDLFSANLISCDLSAATFVSCMVDESFSIRDSKCTNVQVRTEKHTVVVNSESDVVSAIQGHHHRNRSGEDVAARCEALIKLMLGLLAEVSPPQFHHRPLSDIVAPASVEGRSRTAVDKVIGPGIVSRLCEVTLRGGSEEMVELDKRMRGPVVAFLRGATPSGQFGDVVRALGARAARYL